MNTASGLNIAVAGAGAAGIVAAYLLQERHRVSLFEANDYIGGHTHTVEIPDGPDAGTAVDTGFIVHNDRTYPGFITFINRLGVRRIKCPMSFSYYERRTGFQYASHRPFADRANLFRPGFQKFLYEILLFNRLTRNALSSGRLSRLSLGQYLKKRRFSKRFIHQYIVPMGAAIWSMPDAGMMAFPAETFARFLANHGLLSLKGQPQWYTIEGGSHQYVKAFLKTFTGHVFPATPVRRIMRKDGKIHLSTDDDTRIFDAVVIAAHADQALAMLADPSPEEIKLLRPWQYNPNRTILHTDTTFLPPLKQAWAAWNYRRENDFSNNAPLSMTYNMNLLQNLSTRAHYCVTLNPAFPVPARLTLGNFYYTHPRFSAAAVATQAGLAALSGKNGTYFCGAHLRYGFHEDAVQSGAAVAQKFGIFL